MTHAESASQTTPENVQSLPEIPFGTQLKLQKIDPVTGKDVPQVAPLDGSLWAYGDPKPKVGICVGQKVWIDGRSDRNPDHTSLVQRIERMPDGSYRIHTLSSVYRLIVHSVSNTQSEPQKAIAAPVRRNLKNLFGLLK